VHTDHKNLTFNSDIKTQKVLHWRTKIEEFSQYLHCIKGEKNMLADNLSRLQHLPTPATLMKGTKLVKPAEVTDGKSNTDDKAFFLEQQFSGMYDCTMIGECFEHYLNFPETDTPEVYPLSYAYIREQQQEDDKLLALLKKDPDNYYYDKLDDDVDGIICYHKNNDNWKIALPDKMVPEVIQWFNQVLGHPGQTGLRETLDQ
jgi:hypothetical protein